MHDYVIVGAGSAGCVLANRLSEDPSVNVLLLEAGGRDRSLNIKIPAAFPKQFHTKLDWDYATEPEPHVEPRKSWPSPKPEASQALFEKNWTVKAVLAVLFSVPWIVVTPTPGVTAVITGKV